MEFKFGNRSMGEAGALAATAAPRLASRLQKCDDAARILTPGLAGTLKGHAARLRQL